MKISREIAAKIEERQLVAERYRLNPALYEGLLWRPCTVNILMVADDFLYFSDENFGLSDLISILKGEMLPYVRFDITVAHRASPSDLRMGIGNPNIKASIRNFSFDDANEFDPSKYDQIWLFGSQRSRKIANTQDWTNKLRDSELRVLMEFMDNGGGVFATGDHEDLGAAMGGFLPRVRQMRRWFYPEVGPNNEGLAPPFEGAGRFDTNREGHDAGYQFNDQSDDIPQPISPKMYKSSFTVFKEVTYPHPVLCGPKGIGIIKVLPDHPHESQCTAAANPDATQTLDGVNFVEFKPATDGGARPLPEVIATSTVIAGHTTSGKSGSTVSRSFGAIAAYDGHRASVGRIVTDATWHHFININLTGDSGAGGDKGLGFLATPAGQAEYEKIKSYFINIALWISPKKKLSCMRNWGVLSVIFADRLMEVFDPAITLKNARIVDLVVLGRHARDAIGNFASQCQRVRWTWDFVLEKIPFPPFIDTGDPWRPRPEELKERDLVKEIEPLDMLDLDWVGEAALGGQVLALREKMFPLSQKALDAFDETGERIAAEGANVAIERAMPFIEKGLATLTDVARGGFATNRIRR